MPVQVTVDVDAGQALAKFTVLPEAFRRVLRGTIKELTAQLAESVRDKLDGKVLNRISGNLYRSIHSELVENKTGIYGKVYSAGVPYAAIHEYGGVTAPHDIYPKNAKALAFEMGGKLRFFAHVHHPGSRIPERSYMRSSLGEMQDQIVAQLTQAVQSVSERA